MRCGVWNVCTKNPFLILFPSSPSLGVVPLLLSLLNLTSCQRKLVVFLELRQRLNATQLGKVFTRTHYIPSSTYWHTLRVLAMKKLVSYEKGKPVCLTELGVIIANQTKENDSR